MWTSVLFLVTVLLMAAAVMAGRSIDRKHEQEWQEYMDEYAPGWRDDDSEGA